MEYLRRYFQQLIGPITAFDYQTISRNIENSMATNDFPIYCAELIAIETADEKLQTFAQIQLKNWIKQYLGQVDLIFKRQLTYQVAKILLDSQTEQQYSINYEAFYLCLDQLTIDDSTCFTSELLQNMIQSNYLRYAYVVAAACRRTKISVKSKELFYRQFTDYLYPYIYNVLSNAEQVQPGILKIILIAYQQSMRSFLTQEHTTYCNFVFTVLQKLYFQSDILQEYVLAIYLEYIKQYHKVSSYDTELRIKYAGFIANFSKFLPYLMEFAVSQLHVVDRLTTYCLYSKFVKLLRLSFETRPYLSDIFQQQVFDYAVTAVETYFNSLIYQNVYVDNIFYLPIDELAALARAFDPELFTPLVQDYLHYSAADMLINPLVDELCRLIGSCFAMYDDKQLESQIAVYSANLSDIEEIGYFYTRTLCLAQLFRQLSLKLYYFDSIGPKLLEVIAFYYTKIGSFNSFIALWFINATINDLYKMQGYTLLVSELTNTVIQATPHVHSIGDLFESLIFIRYRLNTLYAHKVSFQSNHALQIYVLDIITQILLHTTPSFPFYTEIYESVQTLYELFVQSNPESVSYYFSLVIKALYNYDAHLDYLSDLLELFCIVFVTREAELEPETCHLVLYAVYKLLNAIFAAYRPEELQKLETCANSIVAISSNVEVGSFREEVGPYFLTILRLFMYFPYKYGDDIVYYIAHAIICVTDVFCVWECQQTLYDVFQTFYILPHMQNTNCVFKIVYALAFPGMEQTEQVYQLLSLPIDLNFVSLHDVQAVCIVLYFLLRQGHAKDIQFCLPACIYMFPLRKDLNMRFILEICDDPAYLLLYKALKLHLTYVQPEVLYSCQSLYELTYKSEYSYCKQLMQRFPTFEQVKYRLAELGCLIARLDDGNAAIELEILGEAFDKVQLLSLEIARNLY